VAKGTLPAVSWVTPPDGYDEHPPAAPAMGEWYTSQVLRTLMSNQKVWAKTVVFHCYDENDGLFDHVPPPVPPAGTAGEYVTVSPLPSTAQGVAGPVGLGYRVPMLVISPFSRGGHVASEVADHTSQLRFLEARFGVKAPNISAWRRKHTGDLTSTLHLGRAQVAVPTLPSTAHDQQADMAALGCTSADLVEAGDNQPVYPVPVHQTMPRQEIR
jgi:phospholipase C